MADLARIPSTSSASQVLDMGVADSWRFHYLKSESFCANPVELRTLDVAIALCDNHVHGILLVRRPAFSNMQCIASPVLVSC